MDAGTLFAKIISDCWTFWTETEFTVWGYTFSLFDVCLIGVLICGVGALIVTGLGDD